MRYSSQIDKKYDLFKGNQCTKVCFGLTYGLTHYDPGGLNMERRIYHPMRS